MPQTKEQRRKFYIKNRERLLAAANEKYAKTRKKIWTIPVERQCNSCKITKPMSEFHKATKRRIGHQSVCKKCNYLYSKEKREANRALFTKRQRKTVLKSKYGMTPDEFSKLLNQQNGVCKICSKEETGKAARTRLERQLSVDHCHVTGKIRGLLCRTCNTGIGMLKDSPDLLNKAIQYLKGEL